MRELRPPVVAGLALVALGGLWLLRNLGILPAVPVGPLLLVAAGAIILSAGLRDGGRAGVAPVSGEALALALEGATSARLVLEHGAGTLQVRAGASPGTLVEGRFDGAVVQDLRRDGDRLDVRLRPQTSGSDAWYTRGQALAWEVLLSPDIPIELEVRTGAARVRVDLTGLAVERLGVRTGASDVELVLPDRGHSTTSVSAGAADVRVRVPAGVAASVRNRTALASFSVDEQRFPRDGDVYRTPGYEQADDRAELDVEGGVASFSVR